MQVFMIFYGLERHVKDRVPQRINGKIDPWVRKSRGKSEMQEMKSCTVPPWVLRNKMKEVGEGCNEMRT